MVYLKVSLICAFFGLLEDLLDLHKELLKYMK